MKNISKLIVPLAGLLAAFLLGACDVAFDGPMYHFKMVNRTRGTIDNVTIGTWPCGTMPPERSCSVPYMDPPSSITVNYTSSSSYGLQTPLSQVFTTDTTKVFDEQYLYLDNDYFTLEIENHTTDNAVTPTNYLITGFTVTDDLDVSTQYDFTTSIDNDGETYFLGFFDRYDPIPGDDTGILKLTALVDNGDPPEEPAEDPADWTSADLQEPDQLFYLENSGEGGYYIKVIFYGRGDPGYDTYSAD